MATSVYCLVDSIHQANRIVDDLRDQGFPADAISILFPDTQTSKDFAHEKHTKAPEGTATGVTTGGVLGGTLGLLAGIGSLAIPGLGPFIAAGPLMAALSGAAIGATVGGIAGALIGMGIPEYEAKRYEGKVLEGRILLSVHVSESKRVADVKRVFEAASAKDIGTASEASVRSDTTAKDTEEA